MQLSEIKTLVALIKSGYEAKSIKDELRQNLILKLKNKEKVFEGMNTLIVSVDDYKFCMERFALCSIGTPNFIVV